MVRKKLEKKVTPEQVFQRLTGLLKEKYNDRVELMAMDLNIDKYYLQMILKEQRNAPRWLLDRLGVIIRRHIVIEYYVEV